MEVKTILIMYAVLLLIIQILLFFLNDLRKKLQRNGKTINFLLKNDIGIFDREIKNSKQHEFFNEIAVEALTGVYFDRIKFDNPDMPIKNIYRIVNNMIVERKDNNGYLKRKWKNASQILHGQY